MNLTGTTRLAARYGRCARAALTRPAGRHAAPGRRAVISRRAAARIAAARETGRRDAETAVLFAQWNGPAKLGRLLDGARDMAASGPAGAYYARILLASVHDAALAAVLDAQLRDRGFGGPVGVLPGGAR